MNSIADFLFKRNDRVCKIIYLVIKHPGKRMKLVRKVLNQYLFSAYKISIGGGNTRLSIGKNLKMPHPQNIVIGSGCIIGENVTIYHDVTLGQNHGEYPVIGNDVVIYAGAKIIGAIKIGNGAIVGCNAVVNKDVPANAIVGGVPAKIIKYRGNEDYR